MSAAEKSATVTVRLPDLRPGDPGCGHDHAPAPQDPEVTDGNKKWLARLGHVSSDGILLPSSNSIARGPFIGPLQDFTLDQERGFEDFRLERRIMSLIDDVRMSRPLLPLTQRLGGFDELNNVGFQSLQKLASSWAFNRLEDTMQIYPGSTGFQNGSVVTSNRKSHGLDAAEVAAYIAVRIGLDPYLAAVAGAGHDTGHVPGGHPSEERLNDLSTEFGIDGFNHSKNSGDIAKGLGLAPEIVHAWGHHSWSDPQGDLLNTVTKFSDRIAYLAGDVADVVRLGLVNWDELPAIFPNLKPVLKLSDRAFDRLGRTPDRAERLARMIRTSLAEDVVQTMKATHVMGFSIPGQVLMTELRTITAAFTFGNAAHARWQKDIAEVTERAVKRITSIHMPRVGKAGAFVIAKRQLSRMTETSLLARASEWNINPRGQDPRGLHAGPDLSEVRASVSIPVTTTARRPNLSLVELFGDFHQVNDGSFRTAITMPEALEALAATAEHGEDPDETFETHPVGRRGGYRTIGLSLRDDQLSRPSLLAPGPEHRREHDSFVIKLQAVIGKSVNDKVHAAATPSGFRKVAESPHRTALNSIVRIADAMADDIDAAAVKAFAVKNGREPSEGEIELSPRLGNPRPIGTDRERRAAQRNWDTLATAAVKKFHGDYIYGQFAVSGRGNPAPRSVARETPTLGLVAGR